jgi:hypothetical protein
MLIIRIDKCSSPIYAGPDISFCPTSQRPFHRRECDHEDAVHFYAPHLDEIGMIKSTPQKSIGQGTAWRFFVNEIERDLKVKRATLTETVAASPSHVRSQ